MDENTEMRTREEMVAEMGEEAVAKIEAEAVPAEVPMAMTEDGTKDEATDSPEAAEEAPAAE